MLKSIFITLAASFTRADLNDCQAKASADGYDSEVYTGVKTDDGYKLDLFRITGQISNTTKTVIK